MTNAADDTDGLLDLLSFSVATASALGVMLVNIVSRV